MSFFSRITHMFRAGPADPEGWEAGDWAECQILGQWRSRPGNEIHPGPRHGSTMRVTAVKICCDPAIPGGKVLTLAFASWPDSYFEAAQFRKLRPRADAATAAEAEFTSLVRRKPAPALPRETIRELQ